jgi:hypothetical protein
MNVMMTLGGFQFGISTAAYQELQRRTEYRWPSQDRFLQDPALQFVGPGADTITLQGVIYPEWNGGTGQVDDMRSLAAEGQPLTLIGGGGTVMGEWVIEGVEEKSSVFAIQGVARKQEFTLSLRKFKSADSSGLGGVFGLAGQLLGAASVAAPIGPLPTLDALTVSVGSQAGGFAASLTNAMGQVTSVATQLGSAASGVLSPISRAIDVATGLKTAATDAKRLLGSVPTTLSGISAATNLVNAASTAVNNAGAAGTMLKRAVENLTALTSVPTSAIDPVRSAMVTVNQMTVAATKTQTTATKLLGDLGA